MKLFQLKKILPFLTDLRFAIFLLLIIAATSSLGSIIEQDESILFYQTNYPSSAPLYKVVDWQFIFRFGLDHVYTTWWFVSFLFLLGFSLTSCTITRQFPLFFNSKDYFFKKQKLSFSKLAFFVQFHHPFSIQEVLLLKLQDLHFFLYQKENVVYGYKGLIGRISPILVHLSMLIILLGSFFGAFQNFKAQEVLPKGEIFHIQNPIQIGSLTDLPTVTLRVNDFWVEYDQPKNHFSQLKTPSGKIHQFYSHLSVLDKVGKEEKEQTISVNNPFRYRKNKKQWENIDFYQSDWNLLGIRLLTTDEKILTRKQIYELPFFVLEKSPKSWITWVTTSEQTFTLVVDQFQNLVSVYDGKGTFLIKKSTGEFLTPNLKLIEFLPSTGLLMKYDPSIPFIYFGFGFLMITTCLSYLPYTQLWVVEQQNFSWIGATTNRGKIQLEIDFENFIRSLENFYKQRS